MLFLFFQILVYVYINEAFVKNCEKTIIFNTNFQNSFQEKVCILQNIRMLNFVILKWWPFEYKAKFEKERSLYLGQK